jgi:hypothetical protein
MRRAPSVACAARAVVISPVSSSPSTHSPPSMRKWCRAFVCDAARELWAGKRSGRARGPPAPSGARTAPLVPALLRCAPACGGLPLAAAALGPTNLRTKAAASRMVQARHTERPRKRGQPALDAAPTPALQAHTRPPPHCPAPSTQRQAERAIHRRGRGQFRIRFELWPGRGAQGDLPRGQGRRGGPALAARHLCRQGGPSLEARRRPGLLRHRVRAWGGPGALLGRAAWAAGGAPPLLTLSGARTRAGSTASVCSNPAASLHPPTHHSLCPSPTPPQDNEPHHRRHSKGQELPARRRPLQPHALAAARDRGAPCQRDGGVDGGRVGGAAHQKVCRRGR